MLWADISVPLVKSYNMPQIYTAQGMLFKTVEVTLSTSVALTSVLLLAKDKQ